MKNQEVTIFTSSAFGITKIHAKLIDFGTKKYAQYDNAPFVHYIPKGKRKQVGFVQGYNPYILIVKGHSSINPADPFGETKVSHYESGSVASKMTRFASFDERYNSEFDDYMEVALKNDPQSILMDYRYTKQTKLINN